MRRIETVVDVTDAVGTGEPLGTAVTVVLPPDEIGPGPVPVLFGYPGGGYSRHYFDLQLPGGYSQAEYHARRGLIFVACDHLAVGDSDVPSRALDFVPSPAPTSPPRARSCSVWPQAPSPTVSHLSRRARSSVQGSLRRLPADACAGSRPVVRRSRLPGLSGIETVVPWTQGVDLGDVVRRGTD